VVAPGIVVFNKEDVRDTPNRRWHRSNSAQVQVEPLDYRTSRGFTKAQSRQLLEGHWLSHQQNLLLTGAAAVAKVV